MEAYSEQGGVNVGAHSSSMVLPLKSLATKKCLLKVGSFCAGLLLAMIIIYPRF